jgi:hypothetical protein
LLWPIVKVALDLPSRVVGGCDDARARGGELLANDRVGDGGCHQVPESAEAALGVEGDCLALRSEGTDAPPGGSGDFDRHADSARDPCVAGSRTPRCGARSSTVFA